ncbi:MAG: hypothetical protein IJW51_02210 [Clostridia bacterium]|nr:hypothetical protein [Clostridia bacterium]
MQETKQRITEESFLGAIYKNAKMGADSIINLLPKVGHDGLRSAMTMQLDGYEKYAARAARELTCHDVEPKEESVMVRLSAKMGIAFNTMISCSASHIAEIMIEGSNMGITDMTKLVNNYDTVDSEAVRLAREIIAFEEHNIEMLKRYL